MAQVAQTLADPAPALTRGLALLRRLERDGAASLERLAQDTGWPKSSVARLLASLEHAAVVWRDPLSRRFHARVRLVAMGDLDQRLIAVWRGAADRLAHRTGHTAELHRFDGGRLTLIDRLEPEHAVATARARVGFQRNMAEVDALTAVACAFGECDGLAPGVRSWVWEDGRRRTITVKRRRGIIACAAERGFAADQGVNENGVFRYAAPVLEGERLCGVVAVAQVCGPTANPPDGTITELVHGVGRAMSRSLSPAENVLMDCPEP